MSGTQLPLFATARNTDPETSHEAAASVEHIRIRQFAVLKLLKLYDGLTHEELIAAYRARASELDLPPQSDSGLRTRCSELVNLGRVIDTGNRKRTHCNRRTIVWAAL